MSHYKGKKALKKPRRRAYIKFILMLVFMAGLILGIYKSYCIIYSNTAARTVYSELRANVATQTIPLIVMEYESSGGTDNKDRSVSDEASANGEAVFKAELQTPLCTLDFSALQETNPQVVGWLKAEGTGIDYPIMHTDNNDYYLTHLYDGTKNANGALFIDCGNTGDFKDGNTVIYGHNMRSGTMFHALNEYKSQDFYDAWPTMTLYTPEGDYLIELISGTIEDGDYAFVNFHFENDDELFEYVEQFRARSTFRSNVEIQPGDKLVSMCTCTYERNNARYLLVGRLIKQYRTE